MPNKRGFYILSFGLAFIAISLIILTSWSKSRDLLRDLFFSEKRVLLAKAQGDLNGHGMEVVILKVQTEDSLSVEIYDWDSKASTSRYRTRIVLPEKRDAYFNYHGNATNLAFEDVDNDKSLEIIAPAFDENLIPRLNIYKYNDKSGTFDRLGPEAAGSVGH
jgi:hypothetical protein